MNKILLFFLLLCIINLSVCVKLTIYEAVKGNTHYVEDGKLLQLTCESDSISQREKVEWFMPNSPNYPVTITDSTQSISVEIQKVGTKKRIILNIRSVSRIYSGEYVCRSRQFDGNSPQILAEAKISVEVFKPITVENCPIKQYIRINKKDTLRCELFSNPTAKVVWIFKGKTLKQDHKYKIQGDGVEISNIDMSDSGHYVVKATQGFGQSSIARDIMVVVYEVPRITWGPKIIAPVAEGMPEDWYSDVRCLATGNPMPTIHWFRRKFGSKQVQEVDKAKYFVNTNPTKGTLRIFRPEYPDDNDEYICRAMLNNEGVDNNKFPLKMVSRSINLTVSIRPYFDQIEQMDTLVKPGKTATIRCLVKATDPIDLYWQKYDGPVYKLGKQSHDPRISVSMKRHPGNELMRELTLSIDKVRYSDSWNYSCIATVPGFNETRNGTIHVHQIPQMDTKNVSDKEFGWLYNSTNLTCISYGYPYPQWRWSRGYFTIDNKPNSTFQIITRDFPTFSQSWLQITPDVRTRLWIFRHPFECTASNDLGHNSSTVYYQPGIPPDSPKVKVLSKFGSSIKFSIVSSQVSRSQYPLVHHEVLYRASQGRTVLYGPIIYRVNESEVQIRGLLGDSSYQFNFYTCNLVGRSLPSIFSESTGPTTVPEVAEITSRVLSNYPYAYTLQWNTPRNGGTPLLGYQIKLLKIQPKHSSINQNLINSTFYKDLSLNTVNQVLLKLNRSFTDVGSPSMYMPILHNPYMNRYRLDDLDAESFYQVTLWSFNRKGISSPTVFYFVTPLRDKFGKPARVRGLQTRVQPMFFIYLFLPVVYVFNWYSW